MTGVFVAAMGAFLPLRILAELVNIGTLLAFVIVCAAVLIMRRTHPEVHRPFRAPLGSIVPVLGILSCLMLMFSLPVENWVRLVVWLVIGLVIYFAYGRHHSRLGKLERTGPPPRSLSGAGRRHDRNRLALLRAPAGAPRMKVLTAAQMREADRLTTERYGIPSLQLMENAGAAIAEFLREKFAGLAHRKIVVLCGKGNNGGDGLVVARLLKESGCAPEVFLFSSPGAVEGDAAVNLKRWQQGLGELHVVTSLSEWESARAALAGADLIVDALLGTGLRGPVEGLLGAVIEDINAARAKKGGHGGARPAGRWWSPWICRPDWPPTRRIWEARWSAPISP